MVPTQTTGDCKQNQCDGAGTTVVVNLDTDVPVDGNQCTNDVCASGTPSNPPSAILTSCNQSGGTVTSRDVQRCENVANAQPDYYDVVYFHNGVEHHVQMKNPPGPTIRVNARSEPRT